MIDFDNLRDELQFINQYQGNTFHLGETVTLNEYNHVGGDTKTLPTGTLVRFVKAWIHYSSRTIMPLLYYHFEVVDTGESFSVESEEGTLYMDVNPIWDGDRNPEGKALL